MAESGKYLVKNPHKYKGDHKKVTYRSSWELWYMGFLDKDDRVSKWNSESVIIPYFSNADGKKRKYYMDFWVKTVDGREFLVEIKPKKQTIKPLPPSELTVGSKKRFLNEIYTYSVNCDKWKAAKQLADKRGLSFKVLTEDGLRSMGMHI